MKKTIPLLLILAGCLGLAACHDPEPAQNYTVLPPCEADQTQNCVVAADGAFDDGAPK